MSRRLLPSALLALSHTTASLSSSSTYTTLVGAPTIQAGPTCCLFDSPFLALQSSAGTVGYSANSNTDVVSRGDDISAWLPAPAPTGLSPDANNSSYSHCGKWMNAAFVDAANASVVHGFFHQEWQCNYTRGFTNKSIGYAISYDGGLSFTPSGPNVQIIAGNNFSTAQACGEGDHGVVRVGDYLYLYYMEWNGPGGRTTIGVARALVSDVGAPGTWTKWFNNSFGVEPGVGGRSDELNGIAGTAVYRVPGAADALVSVGMAWGGPLAISWGDGVTQFAAADAGPIFTFTRSSWVRDKNSSELCGYPALASARGSPDRTLNVSTPLFVFFTYLARGDDFSRRWLIRRPLRVLQSASASAATPPTALATLSLWTDAAGERRWATTGAVTPSTPGNYSFTASIALVATSPTPVAAALVALTDCVSDQFGAVVLTLPDECGSGAFNGGKSLRVSGFIATTAADAAALGWGSVRDIGDPDNTFSAKVGALWRCKGGGDFNFSAALNDCASAGAGYAEDALLGYALSLLQKTQH